MHILPKKLHASAGAIATMIMAVYRRERGTF